MSVKNGGTAFPSTDYYDEKPIGTSEGMSLRDYFAARAMSAFIANHSLGALASQKQCDQFVAIDYLAAGSYEVADAMLKARAK